MQLYPYLKDSGEPISLMKLIPYKNGQIMATIDVNSLYTSIKQQDGLNAVKLALGSKPELKWEQIEFIMEVMNNNYFCYTETSTIDKQKEL